MSQFRTVCAWCPGQAVIDGKGPVKPGDRLSHGICRRCYKKLMAREKGEKAWRDMKKAGVTLLAHAGPLDMIIRRDGGGDKARLPLHAKGWRWCYLNIEDREERRGK